MHLAYSPEHMPEDFIHVYGELGMQQIVTNTSNLAEL